MSSPFPVIFESIQLIVVNKPVGIATIPERDLTQASVQKDLEKALGVRLWVVHRLDKEVSGILVFAKDADTHRLWSQAFETRTVHKIYQAWVHGRPHHEEGSIKAPIHQFGSGRMGVDPRGKASQTDYRILRPGNDFSLMELFPFTGRRHQLRVHMFSLGHPIAGDPIYGEKSLQTGFKRLYLHAWKLEADVGGQRYSWEAPLPPLWHPV